MTNTIKYLDGAHALLSEAIRASKTESKERVIKPLLFAYQVVTEIREYSMLGEKRNVR